MPKIKRLLVVYDNESYIHYFPVGLAYIAAVLKREGHQVDIYNQDKEHYPDGVQLFCVRSGNHRGPFLLSSPLPLMIDRNAARDTPTYLQLRSFCTWGYSRFVSLRVSCRSWAYTVYINRERLMGGIRHVVDMNDIMREYKKKLELLIQKETVCINRFMQTYNHCYYLTRQEPKKPGQEFIV